MPKKGLVPMILYRSDQIRCIHNRYFLYNWTAFVCTCHRRNSPKIVSVVHVHLYLQNVIYSRYGDKLEVYPTNEFGIFLKDAPNYPKDGVHDGFNDISPPQEMTLMGSTSPDYVD